MKPAFSRDTFRAGATAAVLSLIVSGGAYAAVEAATRPVPPTAAQLRFDQARPTSTGTSLAAATPAASTGVVVGGESQSVTLVTEDVADPHGTVKEETDSLPQGETKVKTEGVDGVSRTTVQITWSGDQEVSREVVSVVEVTAKVDEVLLVGTGDSKDTDTKAEAEKAEPDQDATTQTPEPSSPAQGDTGLTDDDHSLDDDFARLAQCESGGDPRAVNPAGYYGLYQFSLDTWASVGGTGNPIDASREEQLYRAKILQERAGWGQWGCSH